jgi:hypothetical protein
MAIEWWIVLATLGGPVIAVQTQKFIEGASENRRRKLAIFAALMANRATRFSDDYIRALNSIELGFLPRWWAPQNRNVINMWRTLLGERLARWPRYWPLYFGFGLRCSTSLTISTP